MKLFVWDEPYPVEYGQSLVFAVAETLDEARQIAKQGTVFSSGIPQIDRQAPAVDLGEPSRIVELPCAEWHKWEE